MITAEFSPDYQPSFKMSEEEQKVFDKVKEANANGKTTFSPEEISQEEGKLLRGIMLKDEHAFTKDCLASLNQFGEEAMDGLKAQRQSAMDGLKKFRESAMEGFSFGGGAHAGGIEGVSDFINAGFTKEEKLETREVLSEQRDLHDKKLDVAMENALNGKWEMYEVEAPMKSPLEMGGGKPKEAPSVENDMQTVVVEAQMEVMETGASFQTAPRLVEGTDVTYWVDQDNKLQIESDDMNKSQAKSAVYKDLQNRAKEGEELHPAENKFMNEQKQFAMLMSRNMGMSMT